MKKLVMLLGLFGAATAFGQVAYLEAIEQSQRALQKLDEFIQANHAEMVKGRSADKARDQFIKVKQQFIEASADLESERQLLSKNKVANRERLKILDAARVKADGAKVKLLKLNELMKHDDNMIGALKSGALARNMKETLEAVTATNQALGAANESLTKAGAGAGELAVKELSTKGKLTLYLRQGSEEVRLEQGKSYRLSGSPIVLRACVDDENKLRLTEQKKGGGPSTISFKNMPGLPGHQFEYGNSNSTSTWRAKETFHFKPSGEDFDKRVASWKQKAGDDATVAATGDSVEIYPTSDVAGGIAFEIDGDVKWERSSKLPGGTRKEEVVPKDHEGSARLVLNVFPPK